ncbi:MAG: ATP-binding protein [Terriglobales bacterium]
MGKFRLRTKFLFSLILVGVGLTAGTLFVARQTAEQQVRLQIHQDLRNSVYTFRNVQKLREQSLTHSAELMADLPILKALMTTNHAATIQDASRELWSLAGSDLLVLADRSGELVALHSKASDFDREAAQESLASSLAQDQGGHWWFCSKHLFEVSLQPIYVGNRSENQVLGYLVLGYEIDDGVARELSQVAASQVAFLFGDTLVRSTLSPVQETDLIQRAGRSLNGGLPEPAEIQLGEEHFLATRVDLAPGVKPPVQLCVLKSLDQATSFLGRLNRLLLSLGLVAVVVGSCMVFIFSHTLTRPLGTLVEGVRALGKGDYEFPLGARGSDEVAEVTASFLRMRTDLRKTQRDLIEAERLATIGRMASSISHDLRHSLAAVMANAEFLSDNNRSRAEREELYHEVLLAVQQMTDLIDSLLEFSRTRESLRPTYGDLELVVERSIQSVRANPEYHSVRITVQKDGATDGWFDSRKLERVFQNLLINACEAVSPQRGHIRVDIHANKSAIEVRVADNGHGIPELVRERLFEPFVSQGKENGTGLGLTVVQKIVQDHGGDVRVERTSSEGTVFLIVLPGTRGTPMASATGDGVVRAGTRVETAE